MKKTLTVLFAAILTASAAVSANAAMFTDFENYAKFEEGDNPVYNLADPADYWDGEWAGGAETADELTAAITEGVGFNGSKGLVVGSTGNENAGLYLFATADNAIPTDYTGAAYLRVWCDFTNVEFRKANFGTVDSSFSLFTTDEVDGAWECKYFYSEDGTNWTEYLHGGDGCFGDAQDTSVLGLKGWFAFPIADFTVRSGANWEAYDALTPASANNITGVYLFWDYSDNGAYADTAFVLDNLEFVADYKVFDYAIAAEAPAEEVVEEAPAPAEEVVEEPAPVEEVVEEPAPVEEVVEETAPVEEVVEEPAPVEEVVEVAAPVETAPQTFDFGVLAAVSALVSAAGFALTKKR